MAVRATLFKRTISVPMVDNPSDKYSSKACSVSRMIPFKSTVSSVLGIRSTTSKSTGTSTVFLDEDDDDDGDDGIVAEGERDGKNGGSYDGVGVGEGVTSDSAAGAS